jgi:hypothetical protein
LVDGEGRVHGPVGDLAAGLADVQGQVRFGLWAGEVGGWWDVGWDVGWNVRTYRVLKSVRLGMEEGSDGISTAPVVRTGGGLKRLGG